MSADPLHTLADLEAWSFDGIALAVIGHPVAHSLSPPMHNAALAELARTQPEFKRWRYFKFDIDPAELPTALAAFHRRKFRGLNLTVPHKSLVVPLLASCDAFVMAAGAANTLSFTPGGWQGANTDGYGLSAALRDSFGGSSIASAPIILLGAGGAARGAAIECMQALGADLWIGNRTAATLTSALAELSRSAGRVALRGFELANPPPQLPANAIVINATSLGLKPDDPAPIDLRRIPRPIAVFDMIYRPAQTGLLRQAAELGIPHANGLAMLVHQGARSLALWTNTTSPVAAMHSAASAALHAPAS